MKQKVTSLDKEFTVYGIAVHESGEAYGFNRDYWALPRELSEEEVRAITSDPSQVLRNRAYGEGKYKPESAKGDRGWTTYWVRLPDPHKWDFYDYDHGKYRG
jgi:hypothetical protein